MATSVSPQPLTRGKNPAVLIYGLPGAGKTRFIATGSDTLLIRPPTDSTDSIDANADVEELVLDSWEEMFETYQWGQQGGFKKYNWVWLDSLSLMQDRLLDDVMVDALARRPDRAVEKGGLKVPEFGPDQGEYKLNFDREIKWISDMVGLAKAGMFNFGVTCHPFEWFDPTQDKDVWAPWVQGKNMSPKVCGFMNVVAYLQRIERDGEEPQTVLLSNAEGFVGKDQYYGFPELKSGKRGIVEPTIPKLEKVIRAGRSDDKPKPKKKTASKARARKPRRR